MTQEKTIKWNIIRSPERQSRILGGFGDYSVDKSGVEQAERFPKGLQDKLEQIANSPDTIGVNRESLKPGYMSYLYEKHIIFFKKSGESIQIIRVLHQSMDISNRIK